MLSAIIAPLSFNGASPSTPVRMQRATAPAMQAADAVDVEVPAPPPAITTMRVGDKRKITLQKLDGDYLRAAMRSRSFAHITKLGPRLLCSVCHSMRT